MNPVMVMTQDEHERMATLGLMAACLQGRLGYAMTVCPGAMLFYSHRFLKNEEVCDGMTFDCCVVPASHIALVEVEIED